VPDESPSSNDRLTVLLEDLVAWTRLQALPALKNVLGEELGDPKKCIVYELTDGARSASDIGKLASVPGRTVLNWWQRWFNLGIVRESHKRANRMARLCSLRDVGIDVPRVPSNEAEQQNVESTEEAEQA
jgi:hypothetical protein